MTTEEIKKANEAANAAASPDRISQINQIYDAQKEANRLQLENAYNQNLSNAQAAKDKIAPQYQQNANDLAVQYERTRRNDNQQAAGTGINTGVASQMELARTNEYLRNFGNLRQAEANALAEADRGITDLKTQYQNAIASAAAQYDYQKAAALLDEYNNEYNRDLAKAQNLAQYGDFSTYAKLYGQSAADNMFAVWKLENPDLAYNTGRISAEEYKTITGRYPANFNGGGGGGYDWYAPSPEDKKEPIAVEDDAPSRNAREYLDQTLGIAYGASVQMQQTPEQRAQQEKRVQNFTSGLLTNGFVTDDEYDWIISKLG